MRESPTCSFIKKLQDENQRLLDLLKEKQRDLKDSEALALTLRMSHGILARGIKNTLHLKNWPNFSEMYDDGTFATGAARYLEERIQQLEKEIELLRENPGIESIRELYRKAARDLETGTP